jgi:conjugative relaxase-like TrwC/TraI family protein
MTVRVTTLQGDDAGAYYLDGPGQYYVDGDEPPGQWSGLGAESLGLSGELIDDDFHALLAGRDPRTGHLLGTAHTDRTVRGFDLTCSAPKAVSALYALGDDNVRGEVVAAHEAAVAAMLGWVESHAHCRYRVNGQVRIFGAEGIVAASFRQHTSRVHDPQLHTHVVLINRVMSPDGRWLALDARTIKRDQRSLRCTTLVCGLR